MLNNAKPSPPSPTLTSQPTPRNHGTHKNKPRAYSPNHKTNTSIHRFSLALTMLRMILLSSFRSGLWIFTRSQERNEALITKVRNIAEEAGFDIAAMNDVDQTNCGSTNGTAAADGGDTADVEETCLDHEDEFTARLFGRERTCGWVGQSVTWWRCLFYKGYCPLTCRAC